jgi:hypothetical protein
MWIHSRMYRLSATLVVVSATLSIAAAQAANREQTSKPASSRQQSTSDQAAILHGRVTNDAGAPLAEVRVRVAIPAADMRFVDASTQHKRLEARSDAKGEYRLEIPGVTAPTMISIDAMKPGYRRLVGTLMAGGDARRVKIVPGAPANASLQLVPALYFKGVVVEENGTPIPSVKIVANVNFGRGSGGVERTVSNADGSFELFNYPMIPRVVGKEASKGAVAFVHPDFIDRTVDDVYAIAPQEREALRIVLDKGRTLSGTVVDDAGKPVPNAVIKVLRKDGTHRKATLSDANGKFGLRGLSPGLTTLSARALDIRQKLLLPMAVNSDKNDLEIRLRPISLPAGLGTYSVLGMQLADVTPELKSAYDLYDDRGAVIIDPGKDSDRLRIGRLAEGYCFWMAGNKRVRNVREFVGQIVAETAGHDLELYSVRVVYSLSTVDFDGTMTSHVKLTKDDVKQLRILSGQLSGEAE